MASRTPVPARQRADTDVALETANIALMADQFAKLPAAITLPRKAAAVIRKNIALSLAALDTAAVSGHQSLAAGLLLNDGGAVPIIASELRLLRRPARQPAPACKPALSSQSGPKASPPGH